MHTETSSPQTDDLRRRLAVWREGYRDLLAGAGALLAGTLMLVWVLAFVVLDIACRVSVTVCWLSWTLLVGLLVYGLVRVISAWRLKLPDVVMAALAERAIPQAKNRLINAVHLANAGHAGELVADRILIDLPATWTATRPRAMVNLCGVKRLGWLAAAAAAMLALLFAVNPPATRRAVVRLLLPMLGEKPFSQTQLAMVRPGHTAVKRGATLEISAQTWGAQPDSVVVELDTPGADTAQVEMESQPMPESTGDGLKGLWWKGRTGELYKDARYRIIAGDTRSDWYTLQVLALPGLLTWQARVTPPAYTGAKPSVIDKQSPNKGVPVGSSVTFEGRASGPLKSARVTWGDGKSATADNLTGAQFAIALKMPESGNLKLLLSAGNELDTTLPLPLSPVADAPPLISLVDTPLRQTAAEDAMVPIGFHATDDYGVRVVGLEDLPGEGAPKERLTAKPDSLQKSFRGRVLLSLKDVPVKPGQTRRFRLYAEDTCPNQIKRRAYSAVFDITVLESEARAKQREQVAGQAKDRLLEIVQLQRDNLAASRKLAELAGGGKSVAPPPLLQAIAVQRGIREKSAALLEQQEALGDLANLIAGLVQREMPDAVTALERAQQAGEKEQGRALNAAVVLETRILTALAGAPDALSGEARHQDKVDVLSLLRSIVAGQRQNLRDAEASQREGITPDRANALAKVEDRLAINLTTFRNQSAALLERPGDEKFALQLRQASDLLANEKTYEKMIAAAEALETRKLPVAIQSQQEAVSALLKALDILNKWTAENAKEKAKDAAEMVKELGEKLKDLEAKQAKIAEVTHDLASRGPLTDEVRKKLAEMDKQQEPMADLVEKLAQDLYQFPELPVCNELNSKMREVFEDVQQALNSDKAPAVEIAVQKEDALLDAIRNTKKRVEDVEMWLPDIPDNIVWNMESFDADEFPNMPLVPLPDELEDIVGDLLDQAKDIEKKSQDTTGNNMMADAEMGWGIMDGPMPNFSAKGKSGNTKPNDNEMTGRSGAGREGQSNGELVENNVKGLEGTETHARRTNDPLQSGQVTESEDSTMKARATGGGKLGGQSESIGMFGDAPRRDLHVGEHGNSATQLRQETEALYTSARLLYLGGSGLGAASQEMRGLENTGNLKAFGSLNRRVLRRLEDVRTELGSGAAIPLPVPDTATRGGAIANDVDLSQITDENYRDMVRDYYRGLSGDAAVSPAQ